MRLRMAKQVILFVAVSMTLVGCSLDSNPASKAASPVIISQPSNQTVTAGQTATFSVAARGTTPLRYQWQKDRAVIAGATGATYTTPATDSADNGALFQVVVTNSAGSATSNSATLTVNSTPVAPSITQQPANQTLTAGQTATFAVVASGSATLTYQWQKGAARITGATSASFTTPVTSVSDNGSQFQVVVSNSVGNATSNAATLTVNAASTTDVLTYHNDIARTGQNLNESILTSSNVTAATLGNSAFSQLMDWSMQSRCMRRALRSLRNGTHNLLIAPTEHDSVYAFDADTGAVIWHVSTLKTAESSSDNRGCGQITPEIGVTSTPVIDRTRGTNGVVYVVAMSKDGSGNYYQRVHALDLALGTELSAARLTFRRSIRERATTPTARMWFSTQAIRRAGRAAAIERRPLHRVDFALRSRAVHGMDHCL